MKNQALFSSEDKSKKLICRLLHFLFGPLSVKSRHPWKREAKMKMAELLPLKMYVYTLKRFLQVQASVKDIIGRSITQTSLKTDLIIYADNAHLVEFTPANYVKVIDDLKAGGMTNFKAAFTKVNRVVTEAGR